MNDAVELTDEEKEEQVKVRDRLVNDSIIAVSNWAINNSAALRALTPYKADRALIEVAIGYLIQEGLIAEVIKPGEFITFPLSLHAEHLLPKL